MYHGFIFFLNAGGARDARKIFFIILYPWKCFSNFLLHLHWNVFFWGPDVLFGGGHSPRGKHVNLSFCLLTLHHPLFSFPILPYSQPLPHLFRVTHHWLGADIRPMAQAALKKVFVWRHRCLDIDTGSTVLRLVSGHQTRNLNFFPFPLSGWGWGICLMGHRDPE